MFFCCVCCVLSGRGLCEELITRPEDYTDCDAPLCVIKKPRERGGHSPRWAAEPEELKTFVRGLVTETLFLTSLSTGMF
jgi:hypothetical protein